MKARFAARPIVSVMLGLVCLPALAQIPAPPAPAATSAMSLAAKIPVTSSPEAAFWRQKALSAPATEVVKEGQTVASISVVQGPVVVKGTVAGDLSVLRGDAYVLGTVQRSLTCIAGNAYILGRVDGPVSVVSGNIYQAGQIGGPVSIVSGKMVSAGQNAGFLPPGFSRSFNFNGSNFALTPLLSSGVSILVRLGFAVLWLVLALLMALLFPGVIERGQVFMGGGMPRSFGIGLLWKLVYWALFTVFLVASFLLIGLPFLLVLLIAQWVLVIVGLPMLFLGVGRLLFERAGRPAPGIYLAILAGGGALGLVRLIPFLGDLVWWIAAVLGSGLAIRHFLARSGPAPVVASVPASLVPPEILEPRVADDTEVVPPGKE